MIFPFYKKTNSITTRPWGKFETLNDFPMVNNGQNGNVVIKRITVNPQKRLSYQSHQKRTEHWYIIKGKAKITINDSAQEGKVGQSFDILTNTKHRIENPDNNNDLIFIEVSTGNFDENDIVRYEDDFGRA